MSMKPTWAILWDMDGVIADSAELHYLSWEETLAKHGYHLSREKFSEFFGKNNASIIEELMPSARAEQVEAVDLEKESHFRSHIHSHAKLFDGVTYWLSHFSARGFPQAVASSAPLANIEALVDAFDIRQFFQALVSGQSLPSKPDPAVFLAAAAQLGAPAERCVVIEDSLHGIEGARQAGMKTIAVATSQPEDALEIAGLAVERLTDLSEDALSSLFD